MCLWYGDIYTEWIVCHDLLQVHDLTDVKLLLIVFWHFADFTACACISWIDFVLFEQTGTWTKYPKGSLSTLPACQEFYCAEHWRVMCTLCGQLALCVESVRCCVKSCEALKIETIFLWWGECLWNKWSKSMLESGHDTAWTVLSNLFFFFCFCFMTSGINHFSHVYFVSYFPSLAASK